MKTENMFTMTKGNLETALQNFERFQKHNEKMVILFLSQMKQENQKLVNCFTEWIENTNKAFDDYREIITKGLDYLSEFLDKTSSKTDEASSKRFKNKQSAHQNECKEAVSKAENNKPQENVQNSKAAAQLETKQNKKMDVHASTAAA